MKYFLHDSSSFEDEKIRELFNEFGYEGLGLFYTILEKLAKQEKPIKTDVLKKQLMVGKRLEKCWKFMESLGILSSNYEHSFNERLLFYAETLTEKNKKNAKRLSEWREKQALTKNVTHSEHVGNALNSIVEYSIVKYSNNIKDAAAAENSAENENLGQVFEEGFSTEIPGLWQLQTLKTKTLSDIDFLGYFHQKGYDAKKVKIWLDNFNKFLKFELGGNPMKTEKEYRVHFANWLPRVYKLFADPNDYHPVKDPLPNTDISPPGTKPGMTKADNNFFKYIKPSK